MNIMKFSLLIILPIASISFGGASLNCDKEVKLEKKGSFNTTTSYIALYLDNDFSGDYIYFEVTVYNGKFYYNDQIYYGFRNEIFGDEISENNYVFLDSSTGSYNSENINYHDGGLINSLIIIRYQGKKVINMCIFIIQYSEVIILQ